MNEPMITFEPTRAAEARRFRNSEEGRRRQVAAMRGRAGSSPLLGALRRLRFAPDQA
jgi:hypothetical protein